MTGGRPAIASGSADNAIQAAIVELPAKKTARFNSEPWRFGRSFLDSFPADRILPRLSISERKYLTKFDSKLP